MILIFSESTDAHADAVENLLRSNAVPVLRLNRDELHGWRMEFNRGEVLIKKGSSQYLGKDVKAMFVRRLPDLDAFKNEVRGHSEDVRDYIAMQFFVQVTESISILSETVFGVNSISSAQRAQSKCTQLFVAKSIGLDIPKTYVGANPQAAFEHIHEILESGSRACSKPVVNRFVTVEGEKRTRFTEFMDEADVADLESLAGCPLIIQDYIEKAYELRIAVIGDRAYACKIESQMAGGNTAIDWRRYNIPRTPHSKYTLPGEIEEKLMAFHKYFGLVASSFDFIRSIDGRYVFLETNPYGQWLWIEDLTGLPITAALADMLTKGNA